MPTYDYVCDACKHKFEHFQSMSDRLLRTCPKCGKKKLVRQLGAGGGVIFKGSGFYQTDYKKTSAPSSASSSSEGDGGGGSGKDTSKATPGTCAADAAKPSTSSEGAGSKERASGGGDSRGRDAKGGGSKGDRPTGRPGAKGRSGKGSDA